MRNVIIIGSGPAGYSAAIYAARGGHRPLVIASSVDAGGELMNTTEVENFPGFPDGIMGPDLMAKMQAQAEKFGTEVVCDDVVAVSLEGPVKTVTLGSGAVHDTHTVIFATGSAPRKLGIVGEKTFSGRGVSYCATCDGFFFRDRTIAVVGGGDSAMEEATFLTKFASKVYLIHRRNELRASQIMQDRARTNDKIEFILNTEIAEITGDDQVTGIILRDTSTSHARVLPVDGVFVAIGHDPRTHLVHGILDLTDDGTIAVRARTSHTNIPGVFAAGDVTDATYRQAITAAGSGTIAALDAEHHLAAVRPTTTAPLPEQPTDLPERGVISATSATWEKKVLQAEGTVLVDFWAPWCGPCKAIAPVLEQLQHDRRDEVTVVKVDVEANPDLALTYRITSIPALRVFRDGEIRASINGAVTRPEINDALATSWA